MLEKRETINKCILSAYCILKRSSLKIPSSFPWAREKSLPRVEEGVGKAFNGQAVS